ncbi:MAG: GDSL-type esterase/lipase family protein [Eubacteriales bacterium]|nr:GDSL-type esterase/lipase family protein [Eubacteriales bacterium]
MKKHIVCFGDSNAHGYCADPADTVSGSPDRFGEDERWTCLLQKALKEDYLVLEEGLSGRTTVFVDPLHEAMDGLSYITPCLLSHEPVSLAIIMLGTNDTKDRFGASPACISIGMERLVRKAMNTDCWLIKPNVLVVAPPPIGPEMTRTAVAETMGTHCPEKSKELARYYKASAAANGWHFWNAASCEFNTVDYMHLSRKGHRQLAEALSQLIPTLLK